jgi:DNA repair photolyase
MNTKEIKCKSLLTKSRLPEIDYCINPYIGCLHGCVYCYASFMKRFTGHKEEWGCFLDVRVNAPDILKREVASKKKGGPILVGSVTDAYQPAEKKYKLSRKILSILAEYDFPISILTKSNLVTRDIDILQNLSDCEVGLTLTSLDNRISRIFEPGASKPSDRLDALMLLKQKGIKTYAFVGPILPGLTDLDKILKALRGKIDFVMFESLNINKLNYDKIKKAFKLAGVLNHSFKSVDWFKIEKEAREASLKNGIRVKGFYKH